MDQHGQFQRRGPNPTSPTPEEIWEAVRRYIKFSPLLLIPVVLLFIFSGVLNVQANHIAVLIRKNGENPPDGSVVAQSPDQKGIQLLPVPEGLYWKNPFTWDWVIMPKVEIPQGKVGVRVRLYGEELPPGKIIAGEGQKGILEVPLRSGRYAVNKLIEKIELSDAVDIQAGYVGVETLLAGTEPKDTNEFVVQPGEKGVQPLTLTPGTYVINPYVKRIDTVDLRAHRFDMEGTDSIRFPSSDGFPITMVGTIEWYIDKVRVPEVYVKYVDKRDVITCLVEKIILPNARAFSRIEGSKHLARDFISGVTRQEFQDAFLAGLKKACALQGVIIKSALVRDTVPPDEIATPIRDKEIAIREREKVEQEKQREIQEKQLSMETKLMDRMTKIKDVEAQVSISITKAKQLQRVAIIDADRKLAVATLELKAAEDQAKALMEKGEAQADVIRYGNKARAAGILAARMAFRDGAVYVKYLYYQKIAPALAYILANTDGPFADIFQEFAKGTKSAAKPK
jgi:regulator of protease activity HflC (stomatin/prohibitin superfamily)